jgi:hypothetical protein
MWFCKLRFAALISPKPLKQAELKRVSVSREEALS